MKYQWHDRRKKVRDKYRKKFWHDLDITPMKDMNEIQDDPMPFIEMAMSNMGKKFEVLDDEELAFLNQAQSIFKLQNLGVPNTLSTTQEYSSARYSFNQIAHTWFSNNLVRSGTAAQLADDETDNETDDEIGVEE